MTAAATSADRSVSLADYCAAGAIAPADLAAARMLVGIARAAGDPVEPPLLAWLGMCLALRTPRDGHTCVHLGQIADWAGGIVFGPGSLPWPVEPQPWIDALRTIPALVGEPGASRPFILDGADSPHGQDARLYLGQAFSEEEAIAADEAYLEKAILIRDEAYLEEFATTARHREDPPTTARHREDPSPKPPTTAPSRNVGLHAALGLTLGLIGAAALWALQDAGYLPS